MTQVSYDAAKEFVTIYNPEGLEERVTRLNAHDLIRTNGYQWHAKTTDPVADPIEVAIEALQSLEDIAAIEAANQLAAANVVDEAAATEPAQVPVDQNSVPLEDIAFAVTNNRDVAAYLKAFSVEALRTLAEERYAEKIHRRTTVENVILRIIELETAKTAAESTEI